MVLMGSLVGTLLKPATLGNQRVSSEWGNTQWRLGRGAALPVVQEFTAVAGGPLKNHGTRTGWGIAPDQPDGLEADDHLLSLVEGAHVGAVAGLVEHSDDNSVELG